MSEKLQPLNQNKSVGSLIPSTLNTEYALSFSSSMNTKGYLRKNVISGVKVIIKCCCFYLVNYVMYGFVLVPDCTIHFIIY